ncbi:hypothetical protein V3O24_07735 [Methylobacter sp. Wu8]|uniref:hypothetical protein n=1 Tax=Methylobacter sp. Wu8 TaxID=3118457 RepID=UPI002F2F8E56
MLRLIQVILYLLLVIPSSYAFESSFSSTSGWLFNTLFETTASSFDNIYSQSESLSTATEYRSVKCERVIKEPYLFNNLNAGILKIEEVQLQQASELIRKIDSIQFSLCQEMTNTGRSLSFTVTVGSERTEVIRLGRSAETHLLGARTPEDFTRELRRYQDELLSR